MDPSTSSEAQSESIPPELALQLFENGATLVLKDFPSGSEFGVDYKSWTVGERFLGIKMIPPGVHFIYMSVKQAPRIGFFHNFGPKEVLVRRWDGKAEDVDLRYASSEDELDRIRMNLRNIDNCLGPYPYSVYRQWVSLSAHISRKTLGRLGPENALGRITSQAELITKESEIARQMGDPMGTSVVNRTHRERIRFTDLEGLPVMSNSKPADLIRFSEIPQVSLADTKLKKAGIDSTDRLLALLNQLRGDYKELLAELQYAFVVFLMGQVYEGFEQWKRLIHLLCSCQRALTSHADLFNELLMTLHFQLKECPQDFFHDALAKDNFLRVTLSLFFANIDDFATSGSPLHTRGRKFRALMEKKFGRSFELEKEEEPLTVEE